MPTGGACARDKMTHFRRLFLGALALWTLYAHAGDGPPGVVVGRISPAGTVLKISAIDRDVPVPAIAKEVPVREYKGRLLEGGARYEIELPAGTYDLHVELEDGRIFEGADLRVRAADAAPPLSERDEKAIRERVASMKLFENERHILAISGSGDRARILVRLVRTEPTSYDGEFGEPVAISRWEIWEFRKRTGSWVKEGAKVLRRFLVPKRKLGELRWDFLPSLGGVDVAAGAQTIRDIALGQETSQQSLPRK